MNQQFPNQCPLCSHSSFKIVLSFSPYTLYQCNNCGLYRLWPITSGIGLDYQSALDLEIYLSYMKDFHTHQYRRELNEISRFVSKGNLLDVGCAAGWFLSEAEKFGFQTSGLEPQTDLAAIAKKNNPHSKIILGSLDKIANEKGKYQLISFWSVIEHFPDPFTAIKISHQLLSTGGLLAMRTPNSQGLIQRLSLILFKLTRGKIKFPLILILQLEFESKHWFLFSKSNLKLLLNKYGFDVKLVKYSTSMDWRDLELWLKARRIKANFVMRNLYFLAFALNDLITKITQTQDDLVILAIKK